MIRKMINNKLRGFYSTNISSAEMIVKMINNKLR